MHSFEIYDKWLIQASKHIPVHDHSATLVLGLLRLTLTTAAVAIWNMFHMTMITSQSSNMISFFKHVTLAN